MADETKPHGSDEEHGPHGEHIVAWRVLAAVMVALLILTWLTVAVAGLSLGQWNLVVALAIATVKGALVVLYFMHLRYDSSFNAMAFVTALAFVSLLIGLCMIDTQRYQEQMQRPTIVPAESQSSQP